MKDEKKNMLIICLAGERNQTGLLAFILLTRSKLRR